MSRLVTKWRSRPFVQKLSRSKLVLAAATVGAFLVGEAKHLDSFGTTSLDTLFRISRPHDAQHVVIVEVNEGDYHDLFDERSPLDPTKLRSILAAIAIARPAVIGVDIATSHPDFRPLTPDPGWPPVVWAVDATETSGTFRPIPPVGGRSLAGGESSGLALLPQDSSGVLRRYRRQFPIAGGTMTSFVTAVVEAAGGPRPKAGRAEDLVVRFSTVPYAFETYASQFVLKAAVQPKWRALEGKIALLGGHYRDARDMHLTPAGKRPGVEILAQAIEAEQDGTVVHPAGRTRLAALQVLLGILIVFFYARFGLRTATLTSLVAIPIGALVCSYLAFGTLGLWIYFVPVVLVILVHQIYDRAASYLKTYEKLAGSPAVPPA